MNQRKLRHVEALLESKDCEDISCYECPISGKTEACKYVYEAFAAGKDNTEKVRNVLMGEHPSQLYFDMED